MIKSRSDLKEYIYLDNGYLHDIRDKKCNFLMKLVNDPEHMINKYLLYLRKQEYYTNTGKGNKLKTLFSLYYERKKHKIGNKLGFYIAPNCCESGLVIYHHGQIIINNAAKIGHNCQFHGNNCVGNNGITEDAPTIGDNVDIGFGAIIIGNVTLADDIKIGANAVVNKSFTEKGITIAGVPARKIK